MTLSKLIRGIDALTVPHTADLSRDIATLCHDSRKAH